MNQAATVGTGTKGVGSPPGLRLWPGVVIVALQWLLRFVVPVVAPDMMQVGVLAGLFGGVAVILWWLFFSRAPWVDRLGAVVLMVGAVMATQLVLHESVATGMMGMMFPVYALPTLSLAFVLWAWFAGGLPALPRRLTMAATIFVACGLWALVRTGGFTGGLEHDFAWRWSPTAEDRLLAESAGEQMAGAAGMTHAADEAEWPGFRGPDRDGVVRGVRLATDWSASPPRELWRRSIGPGWSSFAVRGDLIYTQEQRGEEEVVSCYRLGTGEPVWRHADPVRFWESNGGAGPRGTPTLDGDRVFSLGGTGLVNALDAVDGRVLWSQDAAADTGAETPGWGFSGSPLVVGDRVIVAASGKLVAYDRESGERRWIGPETPDGDGYTSPHLAVLQGVPQVLHFSGDGVMSVTPSDGALLWKHDWSAYPIVQPALTDSGDVLISVSDRSGVRRLAVTRSADAWKAEERWTSIRLKPYFNDFVVHKGHAYGFDGRILAAIDVEDGERRWKGGRYGNGQLLLLADQDLLLVLSEGGELALVKATPEGFEELARSPAIEGKTWNHPVLVGDVLLVRNAEEMAAFRLATGS